MKNKDNKDNKFMTDNSADNLEMTGHAAEMEKSEKLTDSDSVEIFDNMKNSDNMQDIDEELAGLSMMSKDEEDFDKYIETQVSKRMRKAAFKAVITVLIILLVLFGCINPVMNMIFPNLVKLNKTDYEQPSELYMTLSTYLETVKPGRDLYGVDVESKGFGRYHLTFDEYEALEPSYVGPYDSEADVSLNQWHFSASNISPFTCVLRAEEYSDQEEIFGRCEDYKKEILEELNEFPSFSKVEISVSCKEPVNISDVLKIGNGDMIVDWIRVYNPNEHQFSGGFATFKVCGYDNDSFRRDSSYTAEQFKKIYINNLKWLKEHRKLIKGFDFYKGSFVYGEAALDDAVKAAEESDDFLTDYYVVSGSRDEIINFIENTSEKEYINIIKVNDNPYESDFL